MTQAPESGEDARTGWRKACAYRRGCPKPGCTCAWLERTAELLVVPETDAG